MPFHLTVVFRKGAPVFKHRVSVCDTAPVALQHRANMLYGTTATARVFDVAVISDGVRIDEPWDEGFRASIDEHLAVLAVPQAPEEKSSIQAAGVQAVGLMAIMDTMDRLDNSLEEVVVIDIDDRPPELQPWRAFTRPWRAFTRFLSGRGSGGSTE